jgi:uncharacterized protein
MTAPVNDNRTGTCPICQKEASASHKPFCSTRCKDVDLGRWLNGGYAIPAVEPPDEGDLEEALREAFQSGETGDPESSS